MATTEALIVRHDPDPALWSPQEIAHYRNYVGEVELTVDLLKKMAVVDHATAKKVADGVAECKRLSEHIDIIRRGQVDPLNDQVKSYNDTWRPLTTALKAFETEGKNKLVIFDQAEAERKAREQEAARRAQEEAARKEQEALAKADAAKTAKAREKALAEAAVASQALMQARMAEPVQTDGSFRSDHGTTTFRWPWVFTVQHAAQVPRQYLMVDEKAIRAAVAAGVREIAGVVIFQQQKAATRI